MMQTLPFVAAKTSAPNSAVAQEPSKQPDAKGAAFNQVLSKQMAQEDAKKASSKVTEQLAQARAKQNNANKNGVDTEAKAAVAVNDARIDENVVDKSAVDDSSVDPQLLALEVTAKTVQDATDGKVVLDAQQTELAKTANNAQVTIATLTPAIVPAMQAGNVKETKTELAKADGVDSQSLGDAIGKASAQTKSNDDLAQQKVSATTDQQAENDQFVQTMIAESKMKSGQESAMNKVMSGVAETSAIATVSIQQPAAKLTTTPLATGRDNNINVYPGKAGWNEAVSQKIIWMVGATEQTAKLTLNPPELGPLDVIINVKNDKADATFISENPEVRKALEDGVSTLRQLMGQAGVELGQANVSTGKQQQAFQQANQDQLARQNAANSTTQFEEGNNIRPALVRESNGLVDIFA